MNYTKRNTVLKEIITEHIDSTKNLQRKSYLRTKLYGYEQINKNFTGDNVLELGSDGTATSSILVRWSKKLTIVDMIDKFTPQIKIDDKLSKAKFIQKQWEEYTPNELYSDILLTDSLEHVKDPVKLLSIIKNWLTDNGKLHIIVPNALSIHRLLGVEMKLLDTPYSFNQNDIESGHERVYDHYLLKKDIFQSGLTLFSINGVQFKPNTDTQLAKLPIGFSDALNKLSYQFNENCAEIYACCMK